MSQFGPTKGRPVNVFNDDIPFGDEATENFLSGDIDFADPMQAERAGQVLNDLNIDIPRNLNGSINNDRALQDRIFTLQSKRAQQMVDLNIMVNKSRVDFNDQVQKRYQSVSDDKGNPRFGTLQEDIGTIGKEIMNFNAQSLQDPLVKERYMSLFKNEVNNQQIDAKGQARTQQLGYMRSSYDVQHQGLLALSKSNGLMDGGLLIKDFSQQLAMGVDQGVLSEDEAVEKEQNFRKALATDKVTGIKEEFDLNTKQVLDAQPASNTESILQGMNPLGKYRAQFNEAGKALDRAAGLTHHKDGTAVTKLSDITPGGLPPQQLAADGRTKNPRVKGVNPQARVAKANEKTALDSAGTVEGLDNSIQQAETKIDELEKQGVMLPNEAGKLKKEIRNKFSTMLKTAASSRSKEAGRRVKTNAALNKTAQKNVEGVLKLVQEGRPVSPDKLAAVEDSIQGTALEGQYQHKINKAKAMSVYSNLSQAARQGIIDETEGPLAGDFTKLNTKLNESYIKDPVKALVDQGFMEVQPLDFNADNLGEQLEVRGVIADVTESQTGRVSAGLTNEEVKSFTKAFEGSDDITKARMLGQISTSLSPRAARELYSSFDKKGAGYLATAGSFYGQGGQGVDIADTILAGSQTLKNKDFKGLKELNAMINSGLLPSKEGDLKVNPLSKILGIGALADSVTSGERKSLLFPDSRSFKGMERQVMDRVKLAYAGLTAEKGDLSNESVDNDRLNQAVTIALGGEPIQIGGKSSTVLRPDLATSGEDVNKMISGITRADIGRLGGIKGLDNLLEKGVFEDSGVTKLFTKDAEYTSLGQGKYGLTVNGMALLNANGDEFVLDTNILQNKEGLVKPKSKTMQEALQSKQMLSQLQDEQEEGLTNIENGAITDLMAHNNIMQTTDGLKDVSNNSVDDIDAAFQVGASLDVPAEDIIALYDGQTNEVGDVGLPTEEFARLATEYGKDFGVTEDMSYDPKAQMAMVGALYKEISTKLTKAGIVPTVRDVRAAQVLGDNKAIKLIKVLEADPETPIEEVFSAAEIAKFPELYSGDVTDVFYKITDLSFEDDAFVQAKASDNVFVEGEDDFNETGVGVFD